MALIKGDKVYRNLQEQVYENTCDIQELLRMYGYHGPYTSTDVIPADDLYNRAMYLIGTGMPYKVYQYNDLTKRFTYIGDYNPDVGPEGPPGPQGPQGEQGPDGKPASEIVNIETYDVVYKQDVTESKVRANFDDGHSNEFSVYAKNGDINDSNLIAGKGITVEYNAEDKTATIGVNDTIVDTNKLNEELSKKQDKLIPGDNITIVDNVISSTGGGVAANIVGGDGIDVRNTDNKTVINISNDIINKIDDSATKDSVSAVASDLANVNNALNEEVTTRTTQINGVVTAISALNDAIVAEQQTRRDEIATVANDLSNHTSDTTIHVTASDKETWSNKVSQEQIADMATKTELGNYVTTDTLNTTVNSINNEITNVRNDIPDITPLATKAELTTELAKKQDVITDLETIRSGASAGATAVQPATLDDYATTDSVNAAVLDINNNKLDKVTKATSVAQVYYKTAAGTNKMIDCNTTAANYQSIMMRDTTGHCKIVDPVDESDIANKKYVDSSIPDVSKMVTTDTEQTISGHKLFTDGSIDVAQKGNKTGAIRLYGSGGIGIYDNGAGSTRKAYLTLPRTNGTLALTSDVPDNYVTLDTEQTITGEKTIKGILDFKRYDDTLSFRIYSLSNNYVSLDGLKNVNGTPVKTSYKLPLYDTERDKTIATVDQIPTNYVTTDTDQAITGKKTFGAVFGKTGMILGDESNLDNNNMTVLPTGEIHLGNYRNYKSTILNLPKKSGTYTLVTNDDIEDMVTIGGNQRITGRKLFDQGNIGITQNMDTGKAIKINAEGSIDIYDNGITNGISECHLRFPRNVPTGTAWIATTDQIKTYYTHCITFKSSNNDTCGTTTIINTSNTPFTAETLKKWLYDNRFRDLPNNTTNGIYMASGAMYYNSNNIPIIGLRSDNTKIIGVAQKSSNGFQQPTITNVVDIVI